MSARGGAKRGGRTGGGGPVGGRGGKVNYFAVLEEDEAPKKKAFALGPSLLVRAAFDETKSFHSKTRLAGEPEMGAGAAGGAGFGSAAGYPGSDEFGHHRSGREDDGYDSEEERAARIRAFEDAEVAAAAGNSAAAFAGQGGRGAGAGGGAAALSAAAAPPVPVLPFWKAGAVDALAALDGIDEDGDATASAAAGAGVVGGRGGSAAAAAGGAGLGGRGGGLDSFHAVASQLRAGGAAAGGAGEGGSSAATWDFSGLGLTAEEVKRRAEEDAEAARKQAAFEATSASAAARVKRLGGDTDEMRTRLAAADRDMSHKQRIRRIAAGSRGAQVADRFNVRIARGSERRRARNRAKHE